jgi:hypothetical protein
MDFKNGFMNFDILFIVFKYIHFLIKIFMIFENNHKCK